jgi:hypothetical protein
MWGVHNNQSRAPHYRMRSNNQARNTLLTMFGVEALGVGMTVVRAG